MWIGISERVVLELTSEKWIRRVGGDTRLYVS